MQKIAFIGAGVMGNSMISNLLQAGFAVTVYNRTKAKAAAVLAKGAVWADTPKAAARGSATVITIVGTPRDVEEVYLGENGIFQADFKGLAIDMTTSDPKLAERLFTKGEQQGIAVLDAPVSGGDKGAREATLSIMVGGSKDAYDKAQPIFQALGTNIRYFGKAGSGQYVKMCNQLAIAAGMVGIAESVMFAKKAGLEPSEVLAAIEHGAAGSWSLSNYVPRILKGDFAPGFAIKHFLKDLGIAINSAEQMGLDLPATKQAQKLYQILADRGLEEEGIQAIIKYYE